MEKGLGRDHRPRRRQGKELQIPCLQHGGDINDQGEPLEPCNAQELTERIVGLNDKLPPDRRAWTRALLVIDSDGEYELTYEYTK